MKISNFNGVNDATDDSVLAISYTTDGGVTYQTKKIRMADMIDDFSVGDLADVASEAASEHQILMWDGTQWQVEDLDAFVDVHNDSGSTLSKGAPVYVTGTHLSGKPTVALADSDGAGTYPAIGMLAEDLANGSEGHVILSGLVRNVDTSAFSAGDALYLSSTAGTLTATRPTAATEKVQKVGLVARSHASSGAIIVIGAGRTNDIPNELTELTGVARNATDMGSFSGHTIVDNRDIKEAMQDLETGLDEMKFHPQSSIDPGFNGDLVVEATSNTTLTFKYRGSDGVTRAGTITLS